MPRTVIVTDSTACIPPEQAAKRGIVVVPLQVVIGAQVYDEGCGGATPELVAKALADFVPVSTSRPNPAAMAEVYERVAHEGADEILSIHLSGEMSGTFESAQLAARQVDVPVTCIDSRQVGAATGYAALSAADVLDAGGSVAEAARAAHGPGCCGDVVVLRRHPRVPPSGWPDRLPRRRSSVARCRSSRC